MDDDWQNYDFQAFSYDQIRDAILKKASIETKEMQELRYRDYEGQAEFHDNRMIEDKLFIPENLQLRPGMSLNCLVVYVFRRRAKFAINLTQKLYKGNFMKRKDGKDKIDYVPNSNAIMWFAGRREVTDEIQDELQRHNIYFKVLRNSPFRRDFIQYFKGRMYPLKRSTLNAVKKPTIMKPTPISLGWMNMGAWNYDELKGHIGHKLVCVGYGRKEDDPDNVAVECETCGEVLFDYDKEE